MDGANTNTNQENSSPNSNTIQNYQNINPFSPHIIRGGNPNQQANNGNFVPSNQSQLPNNQLQSLNQSMDNYVGHGDMQQKSVAQPPLNSIQQRIQNHQAMNLQVNSANNLYANQQINQPFGNIPAMRMNSPVYSQNMQNGQQGATQHFPHATQNMYNPNIHAQQKQQQQIHQHNQHMMGMTPQQQQMHYMNQMRMAQNNLVGQTQTHSQNMIPVNQHQNRMQHVANQMPSQMVQHQQNNQQPMHANNMMTPQQIQAQQILQQQLMQSKANFSTMTPDQHTLLNDQMQAFQNLSQNKVLAPQLANSLMDRKVMTMNEVQKQVQPGPHNNNIQAQIPQTLQIEDINLIEEEEEKLPQLKQTSLKRPDGLDPFEVIKAYQNCVSNSIHQRQLLLEKVCRNPSKLNPNIARKAKIELLGLKLSAYQKHLRNQMVEYMQKVTTLDTGIHLRAYRKPKKFMLRDSRCADRMEQQKRAELMYEDKKKNISFMRNLEKHFSEFHKFHLNAILTAQKLSNSITVYLENIATQQRKEAERLEKERMKRLMAEDEAGYRQLLDEKKDKRLQQLLDQTDEFIKSMVVRLKDQKSGTHHKKLKFSSAAPASAAIQDDHVVELEGKNEQTDKVNLDDEYHTNDATHANTANYYALAHTIQEKIEKQPTIVTGGTLKTYQIRGLEWLVSLYNNNLNGILADEMGLGKTIQTLAFVAHLIENKHQPGPFLIIVPLSTLSNWCIEFEKWAPSINVLAYNGVPHVRKEVALRMQEQKFNVLITTYDYAIKDKSVISKYPWKMMIIDEGHRMKNHQCKLTQVINSHYKTDHRLLLTGTPLQNNLPELWALLNFILPYVFNSCDSFEKWFSSPFENIPNETNVELSNEESLLIIRRLHKVLRPFLLRRLKTDVELELPEKAEYVVKVAPSAAQQQIARSVKSGMLIASSKTTKTLNNTLMHLRKVFNHPFIFPEIRDLIHEHFEREDPDLELFVRSSGKIRLLENVLPKLFMFGHKVLIFSQFTRTMDILDTYFYKRGIKHLRLDGQTKSEDRGQMLKNFKDQNSGYQVFILSTRAGGVGLNLQTADTVIIFDSDWNPHQDLQAQDRAHRIGQKNDVVVLRLISTDSIEEKILAIANYKQGIDDKVIKAGMFDQKSTTNERKEYLEHILLNDINEKNDEESENVTDREELNQMISRSKEEFEKFQQIDLDLLETLNDKKSKNDPLRNYSLVPLLSHDEIPEYLMKTAEEIRSDRSELESSASLGGRRIARVPFIELSDAKWIKAMDEGNIEQVLAAEGAKVAAKNPSIPYHVQNPLDMSDSPKTPKKKREIVNKKLYSDAHDILAKLEDVTEPYIDPENPDESVERILIVPFVRLPSRKQLPHYYTVISTPVDIVRIKNKLSKNVYSSFEDFDADMRLMFTNARKYNMEDSILYSDSIILEEAYNSAKREMGL